MMQDEAAKVVAAVLSDKETTGAVRHVVWVGAGGSNGGNYPAQYFLEHEAVTLHSHMYTSSEFAHATPRFVGPNTLAVFVSMRGTAETIEAARVARELGAATVAVYVDESGLTEVCKHRIRYDSLAVHESDMARTNSAATLALALELLHQIEGYAHYDEATDALRVIDPIYRSAVERCAPLALKWAKQNADKPTINVLASGPALGAAYVFSICNIQEMLQIDAVTTNCCEFFHGPFEVVDRDTSVFLLMSTGRSRVNDERVSSFLETYGGERVHVLDAERIGLDGIGAAVREYFNHLVFSPLLNNVYMRALSKVTGKSHTTRQYMWKVDY